jgi:thiamine-phosphate pyrophosphorylase
MPSTCRLYYITDRTQFVGDEPTRRRHLLDRIAEAARCGVDYIQLREKDLSTHDLELLARDAVDTIRQNQPPTTNRTPSTRLLINSRTDVAIVVGAQGVHLRSDDVSACNTREIWKTCGAGTLAREGPPPVIGVSCHSDDDVLRAKKNAADFAVFGPVFEKSNAPQIPIALEPLRRASQHQIPVFALGGVTLDNARQCLEAGATGIAGIRLFQRNDISQVVRKLRSI